jgi:iron complex transport system substrate-binding protein
MANGIRGHGRSSAWRTRSNVRRWLAAFALAPLLGAQPKAVSLSSPLAETVYALGAESQLLGVSTACVFPEQILADRKSGKLREVGTFLNPDLEAIAALKPDVVFTSHGFQRKFAQQLRQSGWRVEHFEPRSLEDVFANIERVGELLDRTEQARTLTAAYRRELAGIRARTAKLPKVRLYLEVNHEGPWTTGARSPLEDIIRAAGGENVFHDRDEGVFVAAHQEIVRRDPEVILSPIWRDAKVGGIDGIVPLASISARPGYGAVAAVRNSRVLYCDSALFKHEGPRQILAVRKLAYLLHPEAFENPPDTIPWELGRIKR